MTYTIHEPWWSRYQRFAVLGPALRPMMGGTEGERFFTNGHWMARVDEETWQAARAAGWRDVNATWSSFVGMLDGASPVTVSMATDLPTRPIYEGATARVTKIGPAWMNSEYADLLRELGVSEVLVFDMPPRSMMVVAPGVVMVMAMPVDTFASDHEVNR